MPYGELDHAALDRHITGNYGEDYFRHGPIKSTLLGEGHQWEYWKRHYPDKRFVSWECPECEVENVDSPDLTAVPMCGNCGFEADWYDFECLDWREL